MAVVAKRRTFVGVVRRPGDAGPTWVPDRRRRELKSKQLVEECREQFEAGENRALLDVIDLCGRSGQPLPLLAVDAYGQRYLDWLYYRAPTLDAAFAVTRPKGMRVPDVARRERLRSSVVRHVILLHKPLSPTKEPAKPLDDALFDSAGESLGITGSMVKTIWYEPASQPLIKFFLATQRTGKPPTSE